MKLNRRTVHHTASHTISHLVEGPGTIFTNSGATGAVTFTLPSPNKQISGFWYRFKALAAQDLVVAAPVAGTLLTLGDLAANGATVSAIGAELEAQVIETSPGVFRWSVVGLGAAVFPTTLPTTSGENLTDLNADALASGTVPDAVFPATLPAASGENLTGLDADALASGTVAEARLTARDASNGTATVLDGTTSIVVTHGLVGTPTLQDIRVTPTNDLGTAAKFWTSTPTATQFTIHVNADPGAGTAAFVWDAEIR